MEIVRKDTRRKLEFGDLKPGDCFGSSPGDVCIKTDEEGSRNAASLVSGVQYFFTDNYDVTPLNAKVVIGGESNVS